MDLSWWDIFNAVVSVFVVMGVGSLLRKLNWLTEESDQSVLNVVVRVLLPCLIFSTIIGNERLRVAQNVVLPPIIGVGHVLLGIALGYALGRLWRRPFALEQRARLGTFALAVGMFNYGYIPLPLVDKLFDEATLGVLLVHNVGVELAFWTAGVAAVSGSLGWHTLRRIVNPPSVAVVVALALNFLHVHEHLPGWVMPPIRMMGQACVPVGILLVGATTVDALREAGKGLDLRLVLPALFLRLALIPAIVLGVCWLLPLSVELKRVAAVELAMPTAMFTVVLARHFGGDPPTAVRVTLATSLLSLITIPLWLKLAMTVLT